MSDLIYVDTNVFMDYFDGRVDKLRPLGDFAFRLLRQVADGEFDIVISSLLLQELFYNTYENKIKELLPNFDAKGKIVRVEITPTDVQKARTICRERKTPFNDTLHAILAHKMNSVYFVTRNIKDFAQLHDLVKVVLPENL